MKTIDKLINGIIVSLVFLLPLFFLPITAEFYLFNKQTLLIFVSGTLLLLWLVKIVVNQTLTFRKTSLDLPVLLFALALFISSLVAAPNKVTAFTTPLGAGSILALTVLYFVITNNLKPYAIRYMLYALIVSSTLLALIAIYQFLGFGETLTSITWLQNKLFTPAGGPLILISLLIPGLVLATILFIKEFNQKIWLASLLIGGASILTAAGLILTLYQVLPGKDTSLVMLSYQDSWAIAIEAFKQNPFFGVGPGNYLAAFNRFRPVSFNNNAFWDVRFSNASSYPLELLTVGGFLALGTYLFLFIKAFRLWHQSLRGENMPLLICLASLMFLPWFMANNFLLLSLTFIFLALLAQTGPEVRVKNKTLSWTVSVIGLLLVIFSFYLWGRVYLAEVVFRNSLLALEKSQGTQTYNTLIRAINLNPYNPRYRLAYSQVNFALANSLASQTTISDQDRTNITQLIQQAIREAKVATVLNPTEATNWENLAQIYRNLINFTQGADQWAIAAYRQAIITDPINPRIRLNLGGLYYALQNYDEAIRQFQNTIGLNPNYANGYYNLAAAYREKEMYQEAYQAMQIVLNLVPVDSADYQKAKNELDELAGKVPIPEETTPSTEEAPVLTEPSPLPSPVIKPPIELPEEAAPEIPEETKETSPTPKATP